MMAFFRFGKDAEQCLPVQLVEIGYHRKPSDDFRNEPVGSEVLCGYILQEIVPCPPAACAWSRRPITWVLRRCAILRSIPSKAPPQMKRMFWVVDLYEFLLRMLAASLGRDVHHTSLEELQQSLLHPFRRRHPS